MSITHKIKQKENLSLFQTWITDIDSNSTYFRLTDIPERFTAGKNSFLINGSEFLEPNTEILIEILDSNGDPIFFQPIKNYSEGLARVISIEIYNDTPPGQAKITILGQLKHDSAGKLPPEEFKGAYNVKWERFIPVVPNAQNSTAIRLYNRPSASVEEILNPWRQTSASIKYLTGSDNLNLTGITSREAIFSGESVSNTYLIIASTSSFTKQMEGGKLRAIINGTEFTSSILSVINNRQAQIIPGFISGTINSGFSTANFTMSFSGSPEYLVSQYTRSFADLHIKKLTSFTGNIYRIKTYITSIDSPTLSGITAESQLIPSELMVTSSTVTGQQKLRTGYFTDQSIPSEHWVIGLINSQSLYNPS